MKLLITTDFSANSKGALRFAQNLTKQSKDIELTIYHAVHFMKPTSWNDRVYKAYQQDEIERLTAELKKFVIATIGKDKISKIKYVIDSVNSTEKDILAYAEKNKMDFICIATQGASLLRKIMGTHTAYIVKNSKTPVIVIPSHYRTKPLNKAVYLSDFENVKKELDKASIFLRAIQCNVSVLHYSSIVTDQNKFDRNKALFAKGEYKSISLNIVKNNLELSLVDRVSQYVTKSKPELLILFTKREKSFFESIFLPSSSAELTYTTKVPVLIYSK